MNIAVGIFRMGCMIKEKNTCTTAIANNIDKSPK